MQKRLALAGPTLQIPFPTILLDLRRVPGDRFPSLDLPLVLLRQPPAQVVPAIPLEPAARVVVFIYPALFLPDVERLAGVRMEKVQRVIVALGRKLGARKPAFGKFFLAIGQVLAAEDAEREHLFGREFRLEIRMEVPSRRCGEGVPVAFLYLVVDGNDLVPHGY